MKPSFTHGVARSMRVASSAWLAVVLSVMAASASAEIIAGGGGEDDPIPPDTPPELLARYFPHSDLTPYQLVSDDGRCLQSLFETNRRFHEITLAACDEETSLQKFYVLDDSTQVTDFVPQTDGAPDPQSAGANARIMLAGPFDARVTPDYALMFVNGAGALDVMASRTAEGMNAFPWRVTRAIPDLSDGHGWSKVANQGALFTVTGYEPRKAFYGTWGQAVLAQRDLPMSQLLGGAIFQCMPSTFGLPSGTQGSCYVQGASSNDTPLRMTINNPSANQCVVRNVDSVSMGGCSAQGTSNSYTPAEAAWTLRPTTYTATRPRS